MTRTTLLAPMRSEKRVMERALREAGVGPWDAEVVLCGIGAHASLKGLGPVGVRERLGRGASVGVHQRPGQASSPQEADRPSFQVLAGYCGATNEELSSGDVVVATEVLSETGTFELSKPLAMALCGSLTKVLAPLGKRAVIGKIWSGKRPVLGRKARESLGVRGVLAAEMEAAFLLGGEGGPVAISPVADDMRPGSVFTGQLSGIVRVVLDSSHGFSPSSLSEAKRSLGEVAPVIATWGSVLGERELLLASPRSWCAGVERAVAVVERALERFGAPVFVRRQIVHNRRVVEALEAKGAVFVEELDEVPESATVVFSAHGVSPAVREQAAKRGLRVIDATCPLVAKVHLEARRWLKKGYTVLLAGHEGHDEVEGTLGEDPSIRLVQSAGDLRSLEVPDPTKVALLSQTTLAVDEVNELARVVERKFPDAKTPANSDICYATQNRQQAVREVSEKVDLVLVAGSCNSSNGNRLVEVARRCGAPAYMVEGPQDVDPRWLEKVKRIGITAAASTPEEIVEDLIELCRALGPVALDEHVAMEETMSFQLPQEVR
jgi:4-hydroxy-3-methylbut-2-enyl diphosphate reductase